MSNSQHELIQHNNQLDDLKAMLLLAQGSGKVSVADLVELEARVNALSSRFESLQDRVRQEKSQLDTLNVRFRSKPNFRPNHVLTQRFGICARVQALTKQLQEQHREAVLLQMQKQ